MRKVVIVFLICTFMFAGCNGTEIVKEKNNSEIDSDTSRLVVNGNLPIKDNNDLYENNDSTDVETMYLTVKEGNVSENTNHSWSEVNDHSCYYYAEKGIDRNKAAAVIQVGDEDGVKEGELGYNVYAPNATVQIRGQTSSYLSQKNYKITLQDGKGTYNGQNVINLNKHVNDGMRFRNMLCYNLMTDLPDMMSARTKFVHLYVKDETESGTSDKFTDYGLYTYVEQINKDYLKNHGLDKNGQLYKINFFEFNRYEDVIKLKTDKDYDETEFEKYLEIKGNNDHSKLIEMLEDVNDYNKSIEDVFAKWFDEENYFSWLAFHILMGNIDTQSRNTFIYSPLNLDKFYFISWDNDVSLQYNENAIKKWKDGLEWNKGFSNYWGNTLYRRVLKSEKYRKMLDDKIEEYHKVLTEEKIRNMTTKYSNIVLKYLYNLPDALNARLTKKEYMDVLNKMPAEVETNYKAFKNDLTGIMPFYLTVPVNKDGEVLFEWEAAYNFDNEKITYTFELAKDYEFKDMISSQKGLIKLSQKVDYLEEGQYFYRVIATDTSGHSQVAFDYYNSDNGKEYGMLSFYVQKDGSIGEEIYEE